MGNSLTMRGATAGKNRFLMQSRRFYWAVFVLIAVTPSVAKTGEAAEESDDASLPQLLKVAQAELQEANLSKKEIELRVKVDENVATVRAYFPRADGGRPEMRNPKFWTQ